MSNAVPADIFGVTRQKVLDAAQAVLKPHVCANCGCWLRGEAASTDLVLCVGCHDSYAQWVRDRVPEQKSGATS